MKNQLIISHLKKKGRSVTLSDHIDYEIKGKTLTMTLNKPFGNMQADASAFEGWAIVIKSAMPQLIDNVVVDIVKTDLSINTINQYYALLWRLHNFSQLFNWFSAGNTKQDMEYFMRNKFRDVVINKPEGIRKPVTRSDGERYVESKFSDISELCCQDLLKFIGANSIVNQIPVGLFNSIVRESTSITPHGGSAIDLLAFEGNHTLHLFELKLKTNKKVGIITEYLVYAFVMRGVFQTRKIKYEDQNFPTSFSIYKSFISNKKTKHIKGHFLVEKSHPLVDADAILLLNSGDPKYGISVDRIYYDYNKSTAVIGGLHY